jgi:hypothetical protein
MKTTKYMTAAIVALLTGLFCVAAQAQIRPIPVEQTGPVLTIKGVEISAGTQEDGETYGWICFGRATGDLSGDFTLSMDLTSVKTPGGYAFVESGDWTLPVYVQTIRGAAYMGALYGTVEAGEVTWDMTGMTASMQLKLLITGGTETMSGINGTASLFATVTYDEKGAGAFDGTLTFEFQ